MTDLCCDAADWGAPARALSFVHSPMCLWDFKLTLLLKNLVCVWVVPFPVAILTRLSMTECYCMNQMDSHAERSCSGWLAVTTLFTLHNYELYSYLTNCAAWTRLKPMPMLIQFIFKTSPSKQAVSKMNFVHTNMHENILYNARACWCKQEAGST